MLIQISKLTTHSEIKGLATNRHDNFSYMSRPSTIFSFLFWVSGINTHWAEQTKVKIDENSWEEK